MRLLASLVGTLLAFAAASSLAAGAFKLPLEDYRGLKPEVITEPDGTKIEWTEFFHSSASDVSIGRSAITGPLMPASTIDYTDCFFVVRGSSTVTVEGKIYRVRAGDIVLLPRGVKVEGTNFKQYVHFAASFETQPDTKSTGPKQLQFLRPTLLKKSDFTVEGHNMRHVYYQGAGGVVVRAWQSTQEDMATEVFTSPWSELSFVIEGTSTITNEDGSTLTVGPGDTFFTAKGQKVKVTAHKLRKLAVIFDQQASETTKTTIQQP